MTKKEKIENLITISFAPVGEEKIKEMCKYWSHDGLDLLTNLWHKYYNTTCHEFISLLLLKNKERELNMYYIEVCLQDIKETKL